MFCDGSDWWSMKESGNGGSCSPTTAEPSCAAHKANGCTSDGVYSLRPSSTTYDAYCDMTTDGGGWTLVMMAANSGTTFEHDSAHWTSATTLNTTATDPSVNTDMKSQAFNEVGFTEIRYCMDTIGNCLTDTRTDSSALSLFGKTIATSFSRADFMNWDPEPDSLHNNQPNCNINGYNQGNPSYAKCRFGHIMNNENDCSSVDSGIGMGCERFHGSVNHQVSTGTISWNGEPGAAHPKRGWIFVK